MKNSDEPSSAAPRISCRPTLEVRIANNGEPGTIAGTMISANTRKRSHAISIEGRLADRYFAVTSETPRNVVESRISAMPLKGRSARAGARRTAGFCSGGGRGARSSLAAVAGLFSDNGNGALSSLAAAAGGGVTAKTNIRAEDSEFSNRVRPQKTTNGPRRQHPIAGCRYALRAREQRFVKDGCPLPCKF